MKLDYKEGAPPLYMQLYEIIKSQIDGGVFQVNDIIPTEAEYQSEYGISRITVRQAIMRLAGEGYVKRVKGKGTVVLSQKITEPLPQLKSFTTEMKGKGIFTSTRFASIQLVAPAGEAASQLNLTDNEKAIRLQRLKCIDTIPVVYFETYLKNNERIELNNERYYGSLYAYLAEKDIIMSRAIQRISACVADKKLAESLQTKIGAPILILKRQAFDQQGNAVEFTIGYYAAERYEYYFEVQT